MNGVSISKKPCAFRESRESRARPCGAVRCCAAWSARRRSMIAILEPHLFVGSARVARQRTAAACDSFRMRSSSATTSTSPVGMFLLMVFASRSLTVPMTATTYSLRSCSAFSWTSASVSVIEHDLGDAGAVAQVDEDEVAEIAAAVHPSHENGFFARVGCAQCAAGMSSPQVAKKIEHESPLTVRNTAGGRIVDYKLRALGFRRWG